MTSFTYRGNMKISYLNFKKEFPSFAADNAFLDRWFYFERRWKGRIINFGVKHHQITIDLRGDSFEEMTGKKR